MLALAQGLLLGLSAAVQPGPFQAYLLAEASRHGWRRTLPVALAPLVSDGPILALVFFVLSRTPAVFLTGLRLAGGLFVLVLAWEALQSLRAPADLAGGQSVYAGVLRGALTNFLSPGPWLFWGLVGAPLFLDAWREARPSGGGFLLGFYLAMIVTSAVLIALFGLAGLSGPRVRRALTALSGVGLTALGVYQLVVGVGELVERFG